MEALGVAASIVAVVQLSAQVVALCARYIEGIEDAPKDLRCMLIEISALRGLFEPLRILVGFDKDTAVLEAQLSAPVEGCLKALKELDSLISLSGFRDATDDGENRGKRRRLADLKTQLAWPLKQGRAMRLLDLLGVYKNTINLLLSSHGISQLQQVNRQLKSMQTDLDSVGRAKVLSWLVTVNPSINHNQALELHQDGTCKWVLLSPEWQRWEEGAERGTPGAQRGLWIHGIPGSGKTILSSFLANKIAALREPARVATAYYYCHHAHNHEETAHFLAWLLSQLGRQANFVPKRICSLFERDCLPQLDDLVEAVKEVSTHFSRVLVSIDAVDESQQRERLAGILRRLATEEEFGAFHLVVTSRKEVDIERQLGGFISLSMSNPLVDEDIDIYIEGQFQTDRDLQRWHPKLQQRARADLSARANGMFRLVVCQLQILKKIPERIEVVKALRQLPLTLDETYERILINIPPECRNIALRAMCLLFCIPEVPLDDLRRFVSASNGEDESMEDEWVVDEEVFQEILGPLITVSDKKPELQGLDHHPDKSPGALPPRLKLVRLAHYTIKEYLESSRIVDSPVSFFSLPVSQAKRYTVGLMLGVLRSGAGKEDDALRQFCRREWRNIIRSADTAIASDRESSQMVFETLDPRSAYYSGVVSPELSMLAPGTERFALVGEFTDWPDLAILVNLFRLRLYATTTVFLLQHDAKTIASGCLSNHKAWGDRPLLGWLTREYHDKYLLLLLERCQGELAFDMGSLFLWVMEVWAIERSSMTFSALISARVPVNPEGVRITPLQIAVMRVWSDRVECLLRAGADPNAVGCPGGWAPPTLLSPKGGTSPLTLIREFINGSMLPGRIEDAGRIEDMLVAAGGREFCDW